MTELERKILRVLDQERGAMTPNAIGGRLDLKPVVAAGHMRGRGSGHRVFGAAQRIIFPLTALRERGLVDFGPRPDGRSGTAYYITEEGRAALND